MRARAVETLELLVTVLKNQDQLPDSGTKIENTINGFLISRHIARGPIAL